MTQGSSQLLDIYPPKLHIPFEAYKLIPCSLNLTNKTDEHVAFMLSTEIQGMEWWQQPFAQMPLSGIVPSRSTYTLIVTMRESPNLPQTQNLSLILRSSISGDRYIYTFKDHSDYSESEQFFQDAQETGNPVNTVKLEAVFSLQGETTSTVSSFKYSCSPF